MIFPRKIQCNVCKKESIESKYGEGWPGWGKIFGKENEKGETEFCLCPEHLNMVFDFVNNLKGGG